MRKTSAVLTMLSVFVVGILATACVTVKPMRSGTVPGHVKAVTAAVKLRLTGASESDVEKALGVRGSGAIEPESTFRLDGFAVRRVVYSDFAPAGKSGSDYRLDGFIQFADGIDRRMTAAFRAFYRIGGDSPIIERASWRTATPLKPAVEVFVVPEEAMQTDRGEGVSDAHGFYSYVVKNALPMANPADLPSEKQAYWIVIFLKDRLEAGAEFEVALSTYKTGLIGDTTRSRYLSDDGWVTAVVAKSFAIWGAAELYVKANYSPGSSVGLRNRKKTKIAVFPLTAN
jgi:hypothetical protein